MGSIANILPYIQIGLSLVLIILVLIQQSDADLGGTFGGSDNTSAMRTRRGMERTVFISTIVIGILFALSSLFALILK